jgi:hypothetical protein
MKYLRPVTEYVLIISNMEIKPIGHLTSVSPYSLLFLRCIKHNLLWTACLSIRFLKCYYKMTYAKKKCYFLKE